MEKQGSESQKISDYLVAWLVYKIRLRKEKKYLENRKIEVKK